MRILFLAPSYLNLYKPIQEELERQGHHVTFFEDIPYKPDWVNTWRKKIAALSFNPHIIYWKRFFRHQKELFNQKFDILLCINGVSFHPILLKKLKKSNPKIYASLYVWDTSNYYNYYKYSHAFQKISTFDIEDSGKYGASFLPFYWLPIKQDKKNNTEKYSLSLVGSEHDGRTNIVTTISSQLDKYGLNYCFKIYGAPPESPFRITTPLSLEETQEIMINSTCILDTDRPTQTGTTPRVIWALALGKKIVSTNTNLLRLPFYDDKQIKIIDRSNPIIDIDFINEPFEKKNADYLIELRIDNWVKQLF
ncbi:MAG: hypothetical protein IKC19_02230 [Bacteroidales bacterium]|nr:hypothetical protein [Bacteroidales bacterium]